MSNLSFGKLEREVTKESNSTRNHLLSIELDSKVVDRVAAMFPRLPVVANLRNGRWYTKPLQDCCYFKSTDGHDHQWAFSQTRLNMNVVRIAAACGGAILVDSTRRGKRFPDSMKATIPIWAAVVNSVVFGPKEDNWFVAPPFLAPTLQQQIRQKIAKFCDNLPTSVRDCIAAENLKRPLVPVWCSPEDGGTEWLGDFSEELIECSGPSGETRQLAFTPLILLSCSSTRSAMEHRELFSWHYIQGAGDDEENWSKKLTSELFWKHRERILAGSTSDEVDNIVAQIVANSARIPSNASDETNNQVTAQQVWSELLTTCSPMGATAIAFSQATSEKMDKIAKAVEDINSISLASCINPSHVRVDAVIFVKEGEAAPRQTSTAGDGQCSIPVLWVDVKADKGDRSEELRRWTLEVFPSCCDLLKCVFTDSRESTARVLLVGDNPQLITLIAAALLLQHYDISNPNEITLRREHEHLSGAAAVKGEKQLVHDVLSWCQKFIPCMPPCPRRLVKFLQAYCHLLLTRSDCPERSAY